MSLRHHDRKPDRTGAGIARGWLSVGAGGLMVAGSVLPWVSGMADITGSHSQNLFQLSPIAQFTLDGVFGVILGIAAVILGLARLAPSPLPAWLARSTAWPGLGGATLLAVDILRADRIVNLANSAPVGGAWLGLGVWVFAAGTVVALASGLLAGSSAWGETRGLLRMVLPAAWRRHRDARRA